MLAQAAASGGGWGGAAQPPPPPPLPELASGKGPGCHTRCHTLLDVQEKKEKKEKPDKVRRELLKAHLPACGCSASQAAGVACTPDLLPTWSRPGPACRRRRRRRRRAGTRRTRVRAAEGGWCNLGLPLLKVPARLARAAADLPPPMHPLVTGDKKEKKGASDKLAEHKVAADGKHKSGGGKGKEAAPAKPAPPARPAPRRPPKPEPVRCAARRCCMPAAWFAAPSSRASACAQMCCCAASPRPTHHAPAPCTQNHRAPHSNHCPPALLF